MRCWQVRKNWSRLNWFVVSLFIGPAATVLILMWSRLTVPGQVESNLMQLLSWFGIALVGALLSACGACYLVGAGVFTWQYVRHRVTPLTPPTGELWLPD
jgi:hypothetical protein